MTTETPTIEQRLAAAELHVTVLRKLCEYIMKVQVEQSHDMEDFKVAVLMQSAAYSLHQSMIADLAKKTAAEGENFDEFVISARANHALNMMKIQPKLDALNKQIAGRQSAKAQTKQ